MEEKSFTYGGAYFIHKRRENRFFHTCRILEVDLSLAFNVNLLYVQVRVVLMPNLALIEDQTDNSVLYNLLWLLILCLVHCKDTVLKILNKYSQKLNCCSKIGRSWEYINRSQKQECWNWERGLTVSFLGIHKSDLLCSVIFSLEIVLS